jgi:hypothetical protein
MRSRRRSKSDVLCDYTKKLGMRIREGEICHCGDEKWKCITFLPSYSFPCGIMQREQYSITGTSWGILKRCAAESDTTSSITQRMKISTSQLQLHVAYQDPRCDSNDILATIVRACPAVSDIHSIQIQKSKRYATLACPSIHDKGNFHFQFPPSAQPAKCIQDVKNSCTMQPKDRFKESKK